MFAKIILAAALLFVAAWSVAVGQPKLADADAFSFVGYTDKFSNAGPNTIDGGQGKVAMDALCQAHFSPDARMCEGREFFMTPDPPRPTEFTSAWINTDNNCGDWTDTDAKTDFLVTWNGQPPNQTSCLIARPVTCCVPAQ